MHAKYLKYIHLFSQTLIFANFGPIAKINAFEFFENILKSIKTKEIGQNSNPCAKINVCEIQIFLCL